MRYARGPQRSCSRAVLKRTPIELMFLSTPACGTTLFFFFQAEDGIRDKLVTGVQTCAFRSGVLDRPLASRAGAPQVSDRVLAALEGGVLTATLNRPEKKNAIDTPLIDALLTLLEQADLDRSEERRVGKEGRSRWAPYH